jgi:hypothetical protein
MRKFVNLLKKKFFLFLLILIQGICLTGNSDMREQGYAVSNEFIQSFINEMDLKYGLYCTGQGGQANEKIEKIALTLETQRRATIEEAREIYINSLERCYELINADQQIRPYLISFPFPKENLDISISFSPEGSRFYSDGTITQVFEAKGKILYFVKSIFDECLNKNFAEPYEEALQTVKTSPLPYNMRHHKEQGFENEIDDLCYKFVKKVHKKYKIKCEDFGGKMTNGIEEVGFTFVGNKRTSLEKARKMQVEIAQMLLDEINSNPTLKPYLKNYPFTAKNIKTRVHFKEDWILYFNDGSVSRMLLEDGIVHYFKEKEPTEYCILYTDGLPLFDESFEEATNKLKR